MPVVTPEADAQIRAYLAQRAGVVPMAPVVPAVTPQPVPTSLAPSAIAAGPVAPQAPMTVASSAPLTPAEVEAMNQENANARTGLMVAAQNSYDRKQAGTAPAPEPEPMQSGGGPAMQQAPAAAGPRYVPAVWDPKQNPIRAATLKEIQDARAGEAASIERSGQNAAADQVIRAQIVDKTAQAIADQNLAAREAAAREAMALKDSEDKYNTAVADARKASEINPNRKYGNGETATTLNLALGGAIGGMLQGLRGGGRNDFMDAINAAIDRDIKSQEASAAAAQANVANVRGGIALMRERYGDDAKARAAERANLLEQADMDLQSQAAKHQSVQAQENARLAGEQLRGAAALEKAKLVDIPEFRPAHVVGGTGTGGVPQKDLGTLVRLPDGRMIQARTEKEAQELRTSIPAVANMKKIAAEIDSLRTPGGLASPATRARLQTLGKAYIFEMKNAAKGGSLDNGLVTVAEDMLGDPTGVFSFAGPKGIKYAEIADANLQSTIRAQSGEQVQTAYGRDKSGNVTPTAQYQAAQVRTQAMPSSFKASK